MGFCVDALGRVLGGGEGFVARGWRLCRGFETMDGFLYGCAR